MVERAPVQAIGELVLRVCFAFNQPGVNAWPLELKLSGTCFPHVCKHKKGEKKEGAQRLGGFSMVYSSSKLSFFWYLLSIYKRLRG